MSISKQFNIDAINKAGEIITHMAENYIDNYVCEANLSEIKRFAKEIVGGKLGDFQKVKAIYDWITTNVAYDFYMLKNYETMRMIGLNPYIAFTHKRGVCGGLAQLVNIMLSAIGIKSVIVHGRLSDFVEQEYLGEFNLDIRGENANHVWNLAMIDGTWELIDTSQDTAKIIDEEQNENPSSNKKKRSFLSIDEYSTCYMAYLLCPDCYNFADGVEVEGRTRYAKRNGKWFYFREDGSTFIRALNEANYFHYFYDGRSDIYPLEGQAPLEVGQMLIGAYLIGNKVFEFSTEALSEGTAEKEPPYQQQWLEFRGKMFYIDEYSCISRGLKEINHKLYYFYDGKNRWYHPETEDAIIGECLLGR